VVEDLAPLGPVQTRGWFGAIALRLDGVQFAFVAGDRLYLKVDDVNLPDYEQAGSQPFYYTNSDGEAVAMSSYYAAPAAVLTDPTRLLQWASLAHEAAVAAAQRKRPARTAPSPDW
jgi:DNA transformation protein